MGSRSVALVFALVVVGLTAMSCGHDECGADIACGPTVVVTLRESIRVEDQELVVEAAFDDRVLRCLSSHADISACDPGMWLRVRTEQPDSGPSHDKPLEWPAFLEGAELLDVTPEQLTFRITRGDATLAETSAKPTYSGGYSAGTCLTCRNAQVSLWPQL